MPDPAYVQSVSGTLSSSGVQLVISIATASNSTLVAAITGDRNTGVSSVVDSAGNTWQFVASLPGSASAGAVELWVCVRAAAVSSVTINFDGSNNHSAVIGEYANCFGIGSQNTATATSTTASVTVAGVRSGSITVAAIGWVNTGSISQSVGTLRSQTGADVAAISLFDNTGSGSVTNTGTISSQLWKAIGLELLPAPVLEQSAYRWRNDDGTELTATWAENENTQMSAAVNINRRLRGQVNTTGDIGSKQFQLEYRKQGTSGPWHKVGE